MKLHRLLLCLVFASCANADMGAVGMSSPWYSRFIAGVGVAQREEIRGVRTRLHNTGYIVGGSIGYETCYNFRIEGEIAYRRHAIKQLLVRIQDVAFCQPVCGHFGSLSFMANFLYDFNCNWCFSPYAGIGIGGALNRAKFATNSLGEILRSCHRRNGFAWQFIAGLSYPVRSCLDFTIEYRYYKPQHVRHFHSNGAIFGLRYSF